MKKTSSCFWCKKNNFEHVANRSDKVEVIACKNCTLMQVAEIPDSLADYYYDEEYFTPGQKIDAVGYDDYYTLMNPMFLLWQAALIDEITQSGKKYEMLDIGCATGNLMEIVARYCSNINVRGIDISKYAAEHCRKKGLIVDNAYIEKYTGPSSDIITSLETLEHLDDLRTFITGVKDNLNPNGTFLFYVPSVSRAELKNKTKLDVRIKTNLEHTIYFTPEFFESEFSKFFQVDVQVKEIVSDYGRLIVGAVTRDKRVAGKFKQVFNTLSIKSANGADINKVSNVSLKNLIILAAKFYPLEKAEKLLAIFTKRKDVLETEKDYLRGVVSYHSGSLARSSDSFIRYYAEKPYDTIALKILLSNQMQYNRLLINEIGELNPRYDEVSKTLKEYEASRFIRQFGRARKRIGRMKNG
jgi:SAM-dependent methyltransferase